MFSFENYAIGTRIGKQKETEAEKDDVLPSFLLLLIVDCLLHD